MTLNLVPIQPSDDRIVAKPKVPVQVFDELDAFREALLTDGVYRVVVARLAQLAQLGRDLHVSSTHDQLRDALLRDINSGHAFSLLRLGDGEGNALFWAERARLYPALAQLCMSRIWALMFGRHAAPLSTWNFLATQIEVAASKATYLGIPTPQQFAKTFDTYAAPRSPGFDIRGLTGILGVWDWLAANVRAGSLVDPVIVNWHVHKSLLKFFPDLIRAAGNVSVITCHADLLNRLQTKCGVRNGQAWLIPPQAGNIKATPEAQHYPEVFDRIIGDIKSRSRHGQLVFVGAGLPGKVYCEAIRAAGGMAIDVGSLMDVWVGQGVRPYQSAAFVDVHRLDPPAQGMALGPASPPGTLPTAQPGSSILPATMNDSPIRNELEIQVFGPRRSGNHAVLSWLIDNLPERAHFLNNVEPFSDPLIGFRNAILPNTVRILKPMTDAQVEILRNEPKRYLLYNYEHLGLHKLRDRDLVPDRERTIGHSGRTFRLLILRDFWNWMGSRARQLIQRGVADTARFTLTIGNETALWKQYAREFNGQTQLIERGGFVAVSYNEWVASSDYREQLLNTLGIGVRTLSIDFVPNMGLGSSFDGTAFAGQAAKMDTGGRWKYLAQEAYLAESLLNWRADEQLMDLNESIFHFRDPYDHATNRFTGTASTAPTGEA